MEIMGIYKITSPSGRIYIGQSKNIKNRWVKHKVLAKKGWDKAPVYISFLKHGIENHQFKIINQLPNDADSKMLTIYEQLYYDLYKSCGFRMMNVCDPQSSARLGKKVSDETKQKLRNANLGKKASQETKKKMSETDKKRMQNIDVRNRVSETQKGRKHSAEHIINAAEGRRGFRQPLEAIEKMKIAKKIYWSDPEKRKAFGDKTRANPINYWKGKKLPKELIEKRTKSFLETLAKKKINGL